MTKREKQQLQAALLIGGTALVIFSSAKSKTISYQVDFMHEDFRSIVLKPSFRYSGSK
tara:strand:- start:23 stop:196 length:174 start_codon:yes stop_codon:yes gene_type:complete